MDAADAILHGIDIRSQTWRTGLGARLAASEQQGEAGAGLIDAVANVPNMLRQKKAETETATLNHAFAGSMMMNHGDPLKATDDMLAAGQGMTSPEANALMARTALQRASLQHGQLAIQGEQFNLATKKAEEARKSRAEADVARAFAPQSSRLGLMPGTYGAPSGAPMSSPLDMQPSEDDSIQMMQRSPNLTPEQHINLLNHTLDRRVRQDNADALDTFKREKLKSDAAIAERKATDERAYRDAMVKQKQDELGFKRDVVEPGKMTRAANRVAFEEKQLKQQADIADVTARLKLYNDDVLARAGDIRAAIDEGRADAVAVKDQLDSVDKSVSVAEKARTQALALKSDTADLDSEIAALKVTRKGLLGQLDEIKRATPNVAAVARPNIKMGGGAALDVSLVPPEMRAEFDKMTDEQKAAIIEQLRAGK